MEILLIIILLIIIVVQARKPSGTASYEQGYWDGYRAFGKKVSDQLRADKIDHRALQKAVNLGITGEENLSPRDRLHEVVQGTEPASHAPVRSSRETSLRNLNLVLYMASFLLVAAGAAFIGATLPDIVKPIGIGVLVGLFYGGGLILYEKKLTLRPAAIAFAGTGLALLPFFGVALHEYGSVDASFAWLSTSIIGVILYYIAAIRLQNQVVSYLTMAFVISLAASFVASASLPIMWYFVVVIGVSLASSLVAYVKPAWMPKVFSEPIERTGQVATPLALAASLLVPNDLTVQGYEVVFGVATAHYMVAWLQSRQSYLETASRSLLLLTSLIFAWDIASSDTVVFGLLFLLIATVLLGASCLLRHWKGDARQRTELAWSVVAISLQFLSLAFWGSEADWATLATVTLMAIGVGSIAAYQAFHRVFIAIPFLFVSVFLPLVVGRSVVVPSLSWEWLALLFMIVASAVLLLYHASIRHKRRMVRYYFIAAFALYVFTATVCTSAFDNALLAGGIYLVLALLAAIASWVYGMPLVLIASTVLGVLVAAKFWELAGGAEKWTMFGVAWMLAGLYYLLSWVFIRLQDTTRHAVMLVSALVLLGLAILYGLSAGAWDQAFVRASAWTLVAIGVLLAIEGDRRRYSDLVETAAYIATFGLQWVTFIEHPATSFVVYGYWWAITIFAAGVFRGKLQPRGYVAMGFITATSGMYALSDGGGYALLFLVEHLVLLVLGAIKSKSWAIWWGIVASSLAVLYFLRDIAFLAFAFLGLLLIGIVIWRLMHHQSSVDKSSHTS